MLFFQQLIASESIQQLNTQLPSQVVVADSSLTQGWIHRAGLDGAVIGSGAQIEQGFEQFGNLIARQLKVLVASLFLHYHQLVVQKPGQMTAGGLRGDIGFQCQLGRGQ